MARPTRHTGSDSSSSSRASPSDMNDKETFDENDDEDMCSLLSSVMGVKLDSHQMVILSGETQFL